MSWTVTSTPPPTPRRPQRTPSGRSDELIGSMSADAFVPTGASALILRATPLPFFGSGRLAAASSPPKDSAVVKLTLPLLCYLAFVVVCVHELHNVYVS